MVSWGEKIRKSDYSSFTKKVWLGMLRIPKGKITTYHALAKAAGSPRAARAVGNACNINPFAPHVPCHRIVASNGSLGGYAKGLPAKIKLLKSEGVFVERGKIVDFEKKVYEF